MVLSPIERGDITQQSFGFNIKSDEWKDLDKDVPIRTITEVDNIFDVSPVTFPAYPDTEVALRSLDNIKKDSVNRAKDTANRALDEKVNLKIDILSAERTAEGLKR
jgi:phage head maturation protease